jgi:hypothetical protein
MFLARFIKNKKGVQMEKFNFYFEKYKWLFVVVVVCLLLVLGAQYVKNMSVKNSNGGVHKVDSLPIELNKKIQELDNAECKTTEGQMITINAPTLQDLLPKGAIVFNLNDFRVTKEKIVNGKKYTYYAQYGAKDYWVTIAEPIERKFIKVDENITK